MKIESSQIPHIYRNRFLRDGAASSAITLVSVKISRNADVQRAGRVGLLKRNLFYMQNLNNDNDNLLDRQRKRLSQVDKTAFSMRQNGFFWQRKRLSLTSLPYPCFFMSARSYIAILHIAFIVWRGEGRVKQIYFIYNILIINKLYNNIIIY